MEVLRERLQEYRQLLSISYSILNETVTSKVVPAEKVNRYFEALESQGIIDKVVEKGTYHEYQFTVNTRLEGRIVTTCIDHGNEYRINTFVVVVEINGAEVDVTHSIKKNDLAMYKSYKDLFIVNYKEQQEIPNG